MSTPPEPQTRTATLRSQPSVGTAGSFTLKVRPAAMLMVVRVRAAEATLDLGLAAVKRQAADAALRLARLGATRVETGEPHADDHANPDPMARLQRAAMPRPAEDATANRRGVNVALTATWDVSALSAEEILSLVDRLRFDAAADAEPPEDEVETPAWADPEDHMRKLMARVTHPPEDRSPKFLFVARPEEEQLARATAEAYKEARRTAERLAAAAGKRVGELVSLHHSGMDIRPERMLERQRSAALLAAGQYEPHPDEVVSEDPRAADVTVSVHATHHLE